MKRALPLLLAILVCMVQPALSADRDMEVPGNWFASRVDWRVSLGLPVDSEFAAPFVAQYNWAYGTTVLGVNVREFGTRNYYAAVAGYSDQRLDIYDSEGPLQGAAQFRSGRYHVSAGLPDGRIICWLTAPGMFPQRLQLANRYLPSTGFDVIVEPPDPPSATWEDWTVLVSYQANVAGNSVATIVTDGNGRLIYDLPGLEIDGVVRQIEYTRNPLPGVDNPWLLMSVEYGESGAGGVLRSAVGTAWFVPGDRWYTQGIRTTGRDNSSIYLDENAAGGAIALMAWDASDEYENLGYIERLHLRRGGGSTIITDKGLPVMFNRFTTTRNWCFTRTVANRYPYVLFSDGTDVLLGYNAARRGDEGDDIGYRTFVLVEGQTVSDDYGNQGALYPVDGVAMSTHWNTGEPQVFYIQNGSADYPGGQLYQLSYTRPGRGN